MTAKLHPEKYAYGESYKKPSDALIGMISHYGSCEEGCDKECDERIKYHGSCRSRGA